ncbi:hypothetical protein BaRGS_00039311, partial [Batillaria attramentaria]
ASCQVLHGHLVEIESASENTFLVNMAHSHGDAVSDIWINLEDIAIENDFRWASSGQRPEYTNWGPGEPNNINHEDCAALTTIPGARFGKWTDIACEDPNNYVDGFICETK